MSTHRTLKKPIVFVGMMGCGKTTVGRAVAIRLKVPFFDTDSEIVRIEGVSITELFEKFGEEYFRAKEASVLADCLSGRPRSIAVGGGTYLREENRNLIDSRAVSIWLKADVDVLWRRVSHKSTRPLLRTSDPRSTLEQLVTERTPLYRRAMIHIESENRIPLDGMIERTVRTLLKAPEHYGIFETTY